MKQADAFPDFEATSLELPLVEARAVPASWYTDARVEAVDRELIAGSWQYVGPADEVAAAGQCTVAELVGRSVIVVRGDDGVLRAFHNVCRHRAGPLLREACTVPRLQCKYHGWTYALDGRLLGTPQFKGVEGFDRSENGLLPLHVAEWQGMVFVNQAAEPAPIVEAFAGIAEALLPVRLHGKRRAAREVYEVGCNWKTYVDNYMEAYHLPAVHPIYFRTLDFQAYRYEVHARWSLQRAPLGADAGYYSDMREAGVSQVVDACYVWAWPNLTLNVLPGRVQVNHVRPLGIDRCAVLFDYYYDEGTATPELIAEDRAVSARIQAEDAGICAEVQRNLASGAYRPGRLSPEHEPALKGFHDALRAEYRAFLGDGRGTPRLRSVR
jgi:choline monooxygenase